MAASQTAAAAYNSHAVTSPQAYSHPTPMIQHQPSLETDPSALIFSPPNCVGPDKHRPITQPDPNNYVAPTKAAGDVSLSGPQLVAFLTKATLRLSQGPTREGIQLRIGEFNELVQAQRISEPCLKKLNFIVDAIDRAIYDEAWQFFEQLTSSFPNEMGPWTQGLRILIQELRRTTQFRAGSAGPRYVS
ncbi:hypothetical protein AAVH_09892 [Aphelenchoides avenae]|nr:hypothetical protein AAVH_09892 [Aphelenchus avenae]